MLECTFMNMGIEPYQDISNEMVETQLSEDLAPKLQPSDAMPPIASGELNHLC